MTPITPRANRPPVARWKLDGIMIIPSFAYILKIPLTILPPLLKSNTFILTAPLIVTILAQGLIDFDLEKLSSPALMIVALAVVLRFQSEQNRLTREWMIEIIKVLKDGDNN